jgi:hypothetical protein
LNKANGDPGAAAAAKASKRQGKVELSHEERTKVFEEIRKKGGANKLSLPDATKYNKILGLGAASCKAPTVENPQKRYTYNQKDLRSRISKYVDLHFRVTAVLEADVPRLETPPPE